jgi:hypothetical protein
MTSARRQRGFLASASNNFVIPRSARVATLLASPWNDDVTGVAANLKGCADPPGP